MTLGIDFGSSTCYVAAIKSGRCSVLAGLKQECIPSVVLVDSAGEWHVGQAAMDHPDRFHDEARFYSSAKRRLAPFDVTKGVSLRQEVAALLFHAIRTQARHALGASTGGAVIAVPATFGLSDRNTIRDAASIAGIEVERVITEPVAYLIDHITPTTNGQFIVVDIGGGTLDVVAAEVGDGVIDVRAIGGQKALGGDDFDQRLEAHAYETMGLDAEHRSTLSVLKRRYLRSEVERAKCAMSSSESERIFIPAFHQSQSLDLTISRSAFEAMCGDLIDQVVEETKEVNARTSTIDGILLAGGASRMPAIRQRLESTFDTKVTPAREPITGAARGAARMSDVLAGSTKWLLVVDVLPHSYSLSKTDDDVIRLLKRETTIPTSAKESISVSSKAGAGVVPIVEGESAKASENVPVGHVTLEKLPRALEVRVDLEVKVDANCRISVNSTIIGSGAKASAMVSGLGGLSPEQVPALQRVVRDRLAHFDRTYDRAVMITEAERVQKEVWRLLRDNVLVTPKLHDMIAPGIDALKPVVHGHFDEDRARSMIENVRSSLQFVKTELEQRETLLRQARRDQRLAEAVGGDDASALSTHARTVIDVITEKRAEIEILASIADLRGTVENQAVCNAIQRLKSTCDHREVEDWSQTNQPDQLERVPQSLRTAADASIAGCVIPISRNELFRGRRRSILTEFDAWTQLLCAAALDEVEALEAMSDDLNETERALRVTLLLRDLGETPVRELPEKLRLLHRCSAPHADPRVPAHELRRLIDVAERRAREPFRMRWRDRRFLERCRARCPILVPLLDRLAET